MDSIKDISAGSLERFNRLRDFMIFGIYTWWKSVEGSCSSLAAHQRWPNISDDLLSAVFLVMDTQQLTLAIITHESNLCTSI